MYGTKTIDGNNKIDWGKSSEDYLKHRPGPPKSFYKRLSSYNIGLKDQRILDLGTGTGALAVQFAKQGSIVTGVDTSLNQLTMAGKISEMNSLDINFIHSNVEDINFPENSFDIITANQCWLYFDLNKLIPILKKILKPDGKLVTSHFSWLPEDKGIAFEAEKLILKHNPAWSASGYKGIIPAIPKWSKGRLKTMDMFYYDEEIQFNYETWRGRIRASRGISASLSEREVKVFDCEHDALLKQITAPEFTIKHRLDVHVFEF